MALLSKKQFLDTDDLTYKIVDLPELGGSVKVKSMTGQDAIEFEEMKKDKPVSEWIYWLIIKCCVAEDNSVMFEESDLDALKKKSSTSITKLFNEILDLNIISQEKIEVEAKNS